VATLVNIGTPAAYGVVDRDAVLSFLTRMCIPEERGGGMQVHQQGEVDLRASYLALATAHMLGLEKLELAERAHLVHFIRSCQTYEVRSVEREHKGPRMASLSP
jgi:protein farnesyltransferase subunit beta